jgi:hypothetical protein
MTPFLTGVKGDRDTLDYADRICAAFERMSMRALDTKGEVT